MSGICGAKLTVLPWGIAMWLLMCSEWLLVVTVILTKEPTPISMIFWSVNMAQVTSSFNFL